VIKVGTSTLTKDGGPPDQEYIAGLAAQVAAQVEAGRSLGLIPKPWPPAA